LKYFKPSYAHDELVEHFLLTPADLQFVLALRGDANRCGAALLLKVLPYLGYVPDGFGQIPQEVRAFIAVKRVRLQEVNLDHCHISVIQGKGGKDRSVLFPARRSPSDFSFRVQPPPALLDPEDRDNDLRTRRSFRHKRTHRAPRSTSASPARIAFRRTLVVCKRTLGPAMTPPVSRLVSRSSTRLERRSARSTFAESLVSVISASA
jgi:hypothetical protein